MTIIAMIPARYEASRFPGKLMKDLGGKSVILRTYESTIKTNLFDDVFVITDSQIIYDEIINNCGKAIMSIADHQCGSDRIAEAIQGMQADIIVNVQGDEPFTEKEPLQDLLDVFVQDKEQQIDLASLMFELKDKEQIENPNNVKVVVDNQSCAMYFSRSPIPFVRDENAGGKYFKHIGIYAFRKQALLDFAIWNLTTNEATEKIEAIRYLEYGKRIKMVETDFMPIGIDTPEDLIQARLILEK